MKRKLLIAFIAIAATLCCAFGLAACGGNDGDSGNVGDGGSAGHTHSLTPVAEKAATCTADGNSAYYTCSGCDKWFADKDGKTEITDKTSVVIAKENHTLTPVAEKTASCTTDGNSAYYTCSVCDKWFSDANGETEITDKSSVVTVKGHKLTLVEQKAATCTTDGNSAYYTCSVCDKWFSDANGKTEISDKTGVVIAKEHKLSPVEEKEATCTEEGNLAYYTCSGCDKWFADESGSNEITDKASVVLEKTEHNYSGTTCTVCGNAKPTEGLIYTISGDEKFYICSGLGGVTETDIVIASKYNGKPVTYIGDMAFIGRESLTSITIPDRESISDLHPTISC